MEQPLKNRTALITGSSMGIGRATALEIARRGANIAINHSSASTSSQAREIGSAIRDMGRRVIVVRADISNEEDVLKMIKDVKEELGCIDILVNNASLIKGEPSNVSKPISLEEWRQVLDVNLIGTYMTTVGVLNSHDYADRRLNVINVASVAALTGGSGRSGCHYVASKAGIISLTQSFAKLYGDRVIINTVSPGLTDTHALDRYSEADIQGHLVDTPLGRILKPEEVAETIAFLAGQEAINGCNLVVDGGRLRRP